MYSKSDSDSKFALVTNVYSTNDSDSRYYTKTDSDNKFAVVVNVYSKSEGDNKRRAG